MCPRPANKLMILSRSEYLVILTPHRYRRTSTTVSSPSVRGGHAPETRTASSDVPPHHPACMRARCDAPVALLPPCAPVPPNPVAFDHGIYPFDFARTGFDQWMSPPGCVRSAHMNTLEQHPGQTHSKIPSV